MAYCKNCGEQIDDNAVICPKCGVAQKDLNNSTPVEDNGGFGWGLLGCCIPLVGLILFLVWKDTKPKTSKSAGIGALVGVIICIVFYIIIIAARYSIARLPYTIKQNTTFYILLPKIIFFAILLKYNAYYGNIFYNSMNYETVT